MDLKKVVMLPLMIGVVIFALLGLLTDMQETYNFKTDGNYSVVYNRIAESVNSSRSVGTDTAEDVDSSERGSQIGDVLLVSGNVWKAIKAPFDSLASILDIFDTMLSALPFPSWVTMLVTSAIVILVTFLVLGAIIRYKV